MSYILQALAQSERERHQEENPDLSRVFDADTPTQSGHRRRFTLAVALIANAVLIGGIFMLTNNSLTTDVADSSTALITDAPSSPTPIPAPTPVSAPPVIVPPANVPETPAAPVTTTPKPVSVPAPPAVQQEPEILVALPQTQNTQREVPREPELPIMEPATQQETTVLTQVNNNEPVLWDTSVDEQVTSLQGVDMTIHVYSDFPGDRFVFINGKQYREGDTLAANGAELAAITPDGIIVDFGDRRTLLNRVR